MPDITPEFIDATVDLWRRKLATTDGSGGHDDAIALATLAYATVPFLLDGLDATRARIAELEDAQRELVTSETSDGYHTFAELYRYRMLYNAALFNEWAAAGIYDVHKSWRHSDGEKCFGGDWFVVYAQLPSGQISNHYEADAWEFFRIPERKTGAEWDGHTPADVATRLAFLLRVEALTDRRAAEQEPTTICVFSDYDCCCGNGAGASGPVAAFTNKDYADKYGKVHTGLDMTEIEIGGDPGEIVTQYLAKTVFIKQPRMIVNGVVQGARWDREDHDSTQLSFEVPELKAITSTSGPMSLRESWGVTVTGPDRDSADARREQLIQRWQARQDAGE